MKARSTSCRGLVAGAAAVSARPRRGHRQAVAALAAAATALLAAAPAAQAMPITWDVVVNNGFLAPGSTTQLFNSYSGSSVNNEALVTFRGRTQGQGGRISGVFSRDMGVPAAPVKAVAVVGQEVPQPNNLGATFNEFPSFPRIDAGSSLIATRGQTKPVWEYTPIGGTETRVGTSGIYATPGGVLTTGMQKLGDVPAFPQFQVPQPAVGADGLKFEQVPGAPAAFDGQFIAFKGNYADENKVSQTGVFYRDIVSDNGEKGAVAIAYRGLEMPNVPGTAFGSTSPPSAAKGKVVFTGLDNEEAPNAGGIYLHKVGTPGLTTLVAIGDTVPGGTFGNGNTLNRLGEGLSFDGRYVSFWGAWGSETQTVTVRCAAEGNAIVKQYCIDNDNNGTPIDGIYEFDVPLHQGIFQKDTATGVLKLVAETGSEYKDFLFWNFSGNAGQGGGEEEEEGARWRSSAFVAADGQKVVFKALEPVDDVFGLYLDLDLSDLLDPFALLTTGMDGGILDPLAAGLSITELAIERDSFRNGWLVVNAAMEGIIGGEELGWAGVYITRVPEPASAALVGLGLALAGFTRRRHGLRAA